MTARILHRLRDERGIALIMALGIMIGLAIVVTAAVQYTTANTRGASSSLSRVDARQVAEAGMNAALAVLNNGNPNNASALGSSTSPNTVSIPGGTASYYGSLSNGTWTIVSNGSTPNPSSGGNSTSSLTAHVVVQPSQLYQSTPSNNPWVYMWAKDTGGATCDENINTLVGVPLVVLGKLCLDDPGSVEAQTGLVSGPLHVKGTPIWIKNTKAKIANTSFNGFTGGASFSATTQCKNSYNGATGLNPHTCLTGLATSKDNIYAFNNNVTSIGAPVADFDYWYRQASPGPFAQCGASSTGGTYLPTFENETSSPTRNNSMNSGSVIDLTPVGHSYDCIVGAPNSGWCGSGNNQNQGEISWDATNKVLTVIGTVYIDGSVKISNASTTTDTYACWGSIYVSGTILMQHTKLCGAILDTNCVDGDKGWFDHWYPFFNWLFLIADGDGAAGGAAAQVPAGDSIKLVDSTFQGALYGTKAIEFDATSHLQGPAVGGSLIFDGDFVSTPWDQSSSRMPTGTPGITQNSKTAISPPTYG